jgi:hypothetical protein
MHDRLVNAVRLIVVFVARSKHVADLMRYDTEYGILGAIIAGRYRLGCWLRRDIRRAA